MKADGLHDPLPQFHRGDGRASRSARREDTVCSVEHWHQRLIPSHGPLRRLLGRVVVLLALFLLVFSRLCHDPVSLMPILCGQLAASALIDFLAGLVRRKRRPLRHHSEVGRDLQQRIEHQGPRLGDGLFHRQHPDDVIAEATICGRRRQYLYVQCSTWNMANLYVHIQRWWSKAQAHKRRNKGVALDFIVTTGQTFEPRQTPKLLIMLMVKCGKRETGV